MYLVVLVPLWCSSKIYQLRYPRRVSLMSLLKSLCNIPLNWGLENLVVKCEVLWYEMFQPSISELLEACRIMQNHTEAYTHPFMAYIVYSDLINYFKVLKICDRINFKTLWNEVMKHHMSFNANNTPNLDIRRTFCMYKTWNVRRLP